MKNDVQTHGKRNKNQTKSGIIDHNNQVVINQMK